VRRLSRTLALSSILLIAGSACDKSGSGGATTSADGATDVTNYGYDNTSSPDMAAVSPALAPDDLEGVQGRGLTIWRMQRAMRLGDREFASFVGVTGAKFQALASIDPGGKSGEVAFYRWDDDTLQSGKADAADALRWVVVSVSIDPDEALDPQKIEGKPDDEQRRALAAVLVAQAKAAADYPGSRFVAYTFREQQMKAGEATGAGQTRVYMVGADDKSPDVEYTVLDALKRKQEPQIIDELVALPREGTSKLPLVTPAQSPGPSTIARAVAIATVTSKPVEIVDAAGNKWTVAPKTGVLTRQ